jgi:peptide/nickel transport system substrate-binding protein
LRHCLAAAGLAALVACGPETESHPASGEKVLRVVPDTDLEILDPTWTTGYTTRDHGYMVYDTLFGIDEDGRVAPQMVESWEVSPDRKTWTFMLRDGLEFHDGQPVTSEDVIASIRRWAHRDTMGQRLLSFVIGLDAVSPTVFRMMLKAPYGLVLESFGKPDSYVLFILPKRLASTPVDRQIDGVIGSGPFIFQKDEWRPGERAVYTRNPKYKPRPEPSSGTAGGKIVKVDRVEWVTIKDAQTQTNALLAGEVDILAQVPPDQYPALKNDPGVQMLSINPTGFQLFLRFNHLQPPFDNPKVRHAAMAALNQPAFLQTIFTSPELANPCFSIYPCGAPFATPAGMDFIARPDMERARTRLKQSGYGGQPVILLRQTDITIPSKASVVATHLLREAGFTVDMQSMDMNTLLSRRARKDGWHMFITYGAWSAGTAPVSQNQLSAACSAAWFGWPCDAGLEELRDAFAFAATPEDRKTIAERIQVRAMEVGTHVALGEFRMMTAARKNVTGFLTGHNFNLYWNVEKQ